jgi:hypothetical protein
VTDNIGLTTLGSTSDPALTSTCSEDYSADFSIRLDRLKLYMNVNPSLDSREEYVMLLFPCTTSERVSLCKLSQCQVKKAPGLLLQKLYRNGSPVPAIAREAFLQNSRDIDVVISRKSNQA